MVTFESSGKLAMDSGVRPEDFNSVKNEGVSDEWFRFWALLEVCKVARTNFIKEKKLQREKAKKEKKKSRKTGLTTEESMKSTGRRKYGDDPEWKLETWALTELEDAEDGDREWTLETRTCWELEAAEGLGFAGASLSRKKWSCTEKSNKKMNKKCLMRDDDPEWNSDIRACSGIDDAEGSGFARTLASLPPSSSRKKSENQVNKKRAEGSEDRPAMPRELKDHITWVLVGKEVRLIIQKRLTQSDVSRGLCCLSIPKNQIIDSQFLREDEKKLLEASVDKDVRVLCYRSPVEKLGEKVLKLGLWATNKKPKGQRAAGGEEREPLVTHAGRTYDTGGGQEEARSLKKKGEFGGMDGGEGPRPSSVYILWSGWPQFARDNKLKLDDVVQIWSFRVDSDLARDELRLALIVLSGKQARESWGVAT